MLWIMFSLIFFWFFFKEWNSQLPTSNTYLAIMFVLGLVCALPPIQHWRFEHLLTQIARKLAEGHPANVHCNTLFDTMFDEEIGISGHADPRTGYIVIQYPVCSTLMNYLKHPYRANKDEIISLHILTHESMHARGEYNEAKTECEAIQRDQRTAKYLGVPDSIANQTAMDYYKNFYLKRTDSYFSKECAPGKNMDEHLSDAIWND
ncbi:MAG: hypothetical protein PSV35_04230 [bacterium]|nr:hypothetical protein [bacterium]